MKKYSIFAGIIIALASAIAITSAWHDSPIVDEIPHIGAGYSYVAGHTYKFNPEHPPLAKDLAGLALLPLKIDSVILNGTFQGNWPSDIHGQWNFGRALIYSSGTDPIKIVHFAKLPLMLFFIFSAILIFIWTKKIYSPRSALLAVFLFALSPTVIAHSRFVTTDVPALFGILFATYFFTRYIKSNTTTNFWLASISFGVAMLTKFSTILLVPYFIIIVIVWTWIHEQRFFYPTVRGLIKTGLIIVAGFVIIVGPVYQLHLLKYSGAQQKADATITLGNYGSPLIANAIIWASDKPIIRPLAEYGLGLAMVSQRAEGGNRTYFLGQLSNSSFRSYFPIVYLLKEPIPLLILLFSAVWFGLTSWFKSRESIRNKFKDHFYEFVMALWIIIYMAISIRSNLNIGIRHLMPIYGFIFILIAGQIGNITHQFKPKKWFTIFTFILCGWYVGEFISVYPSYLAYFNQFAGGPSGGHRYVVDSNLDWGQDLWRLADYAEENKISTMNLDYFGWADPAYYLGSAHKYMRGGTYTNKESFLKDNPNGGWLAVSTTFYQESGLSAERPYAWLNNIEPATTIGHSIFVWHITP